MLTVDWGNHYKSQMNDIQIIEFCWLAAWLIVLRYITLHLVLIKYGAGWHKHLKSRDCTSPGVSSHTLGDSSSDLIHRFVTALYSLLWSELNVLNFKVLYNIQLLGGWYPHFPVSWQVYFLRILTKFQAHAVIGITRPYGLKAAIHRHFDIIIFENQYRKVLRCWQNWARRCVLT